MLLLLVILFAWAGILWLEMFSCRYSWEDLRRVIAFQMLTEEFLTGESQSARRTGMYLWLWFC